MLARQADLDGDGVLSEKEFAKAVLTMGFANATKAMIDATFAALDTDSSGTLDYLELDKRLRRLGDRPVPPPEPHPELVPPSSTAVTGSQSARPRRNWARQTIGGILSGRAMRSGIISSAGYASETHFSATLPARFKRSLQRRAPAARARESSF